MTTPNVIRLTDVGEQAINNASAGGIQIKPHTFIIGEYTGDAPPIVPTKCIGNPLDSGRIRYIQVLSSKTSRFTMELGEDVSGNIGECVIYLDDGTPLGHATIKPNKTKVKGVAMRLELVMHLGEFSTDIISVELCEYASIPSVANVEALPSPVNAMENAIAVLDLNSNPDGSRSPNVAVRYGAGSQHWGFAGWNRLFSGTIGAAKVLSNSEFRVPDILVGVIPEGNVLLQTVTGASAGECRKAVCSGSLIRCTEKAFTTLSGDDAVNIWIPATGEVTSSLPSREGVPADWVLTAGKDRPIWAKQQAGGSGVGSSLYFPPSKLKLNSMMMDGTGEITYDLGLKPKSSAFVMTSISGLSQNHNAFLVSGSNITYAEPIRDVWTMMNRTFTHEASTGDYLTIKVAHHVADGTKRKFKLGVEVASETDVIVYVEKMDQNLNSYTVDLTTMEVVFNTAPKAGFPIELNALVYTKESGYSTEMEVFTFRTQEASSVFQLPIEPEDIGMVFLSVQGIHIHKDRLSMSRGTVIVTENLLPDLDIEILVFRNRLSQGSPSADLSGVVTSGIATSMGVELLRHNAESIQIPLPKLNVLGSENIEVIGDFPNFKIQYKSGGANSKYPSGKIMDARTLNISKQGIQEVTLPIKIDLQGNDVAIEASAHFNGELGPGFYSENGLENMQAVLAVKTANAEEPEYDTRARGTVNSGFSFLGGSSGDEAIAYSESSRSMAMTIQADNHKSKYVTLVAKVRFASVDIEKYDAFLGIEVALKVTVI